MADKKHKKSKEPLYKVQETLPDIPGMPNKEVVVPSKGPEGMMKYGMGENRLTTPDMPGLPSNVPAGQLQAKQQAELNNQNILNQATETRSKEERQLDPNNKIFDPDVAVEKVLSNPNEEETKKQWADERAEREQGMQDSNDLLLQQQEQERKDLQASGSAPAETYETPTNTAVEEATGNATGSGKASDLQYEPTLKGRIQDWLSNRQAKRKANALNRVGVDEFGNTKQARNIMDAYLTGQISKDERNYYLADAFAKFAKDMGKNVGNVGAAFTGGTIDNSDTGNSAWQDRMSKLSENAAQTAAEKEGGPAQRKARLEEAQAQLQETMAQYSPQEKEAQLQIIKNLANNAKSMTDLMGQIDSSNLPDETKPLLKIFAQGAGGIPAFLGMLMTKAIF